MTKCCVSGCPNSFGRVKGIPMFHFPKKIDVRKKWIEQVGIDPMAIRENTRLCRLHFFDDDLFHFSTKTILKPGRVPHFDRVPPDGAEEPFRQELRGTSNEQINTSESASRRPKNWQLFRKRRVRTESPFLIENFKKLNKKIFYYTGMPNYRTLVIVYKSVYNCDSVSPQETTHKKWRKLTPLNEFFLTLMKLRLGFDSLILADMFQICVATVERIFATWINLLHEKLTGCNIFPHRDLLAKEAPPGFSKKYPNVIGSIDCVELDIETALAFVKQSQCVSDYKDAVTLKSLIVINATGGIIFVSALYNTESVSDKKILEDSGFVDLLRNKITKGELQPGDIILADEGVNVENLIEDFDHDLNVPTFRLTGMQYHPDELEYIRTIAHQRAHVEKAICRLKSFKILSQKIPISLLGSVNQIFTVCALLTNFR